MAGMEPMEQLETHCFHVFDTIPMIPFKPLQHGRRFKNTTLTSSDALFRVTMLQSINLPFCNSSSSINSADYELPRHFPIVS
jgi:hypothetical protein